MGHLSTAIAAVAIWTLSLATACAQEAEDNSSHWITPAETVPEGYEADDLGAWAVARRYSRENSAIGVAVYVTESVEADKAEQYGQGLVNLFAKENIPAEYFLGRMDGDTDSIGFRLYVYGYGVGSYTAETIRDGIKLATDAYNGEDYVMEMLEDGDL